MQNGCTGILWSENHSHAVHNGGGEPNPMPSSLYGTPQTEEEKQQGGLIDVEYQSEIFADAGPYGGYAADTEATLAPKFLKSMGAEGGYNPFFDKTILRSDSSISAQTHEARHRADRQREGIVGSIRETIFDKGHDEVYIAAGWNTEDLIQVMRAQIHYDNAYPEQAKPRTNTEAAEEMISHLKRLKKEFVRREVEAAFGIEKGTYKQLTRKYTDKANKRLKILDLKLAVQKEKDKENKQLEDRKKGLKKWIEDRKKWLANKKFDPEWSTSRDSVFYNKVGDIVGFADLEDTSKSQWQDREPIFQHRTK
jgi:hypothetical protein